MQAFLDKLAELIAQKVADKVAAQLTGVISAQIVGAEQNLLATAQAYEAKIDQFPQQIVQEVLQGLNPFKVRRG